MYNTRLNTTVNGPAHLGHIYMALINQEVAESSGGKFVVRFDDTNAAWITTIGRARMDIIMSEQTEDMKWLGISPDEWTRQSSIIEEVRKWLDGKMRILPDDPLPYTPGIVGEDGLVMYPLTPALTAEKVVMDWMEGTNFLVRGLDLITEYSLYQYYCRVLGLPEPKHIYLPRMRWGKGDMSKSGGSQTVRDMRINGYTPAQVISKVEKACLILPANGWEFSNIKAVPWL